MVVTWAQLERAIKKAIGSAVVQTVEQTRKTYASLYGSTSSQLSSTGNYKKEVSTGGFVSSGAITPIASPRPSVWRNPKSQPTPQSLAYMMEVGGRMDLKRYISSGYRDTSGRQPAVPRRALAQQFMNNEIQRQLMKQGFTH